MKTNYQQELQELLEQIVKAINEEDTNQLNVLANRGGKLLKGRKENKKIKEEKFIAKVNTKVKPSMKEWFELESTRRGVVTAVLYREAFNQYINNTEGELE